MGVANCTEPMHEGIWAYRSIPTSCKFLFGQSVDLLSCLVLPGPYIHFYPVRRDRCLGSCAWCSWMNQASLNFEPQSTIHLNKHCNFHSWVFFLMLAILRKTSKVQFLLKGTKNPPPTATKLEVRKYVWPVGSPCAFCTASSSSRGDIADISRSSFQRVFDRLQTWQQ